MTKFAGSQEFVNQITDAQRKRYTDHFNEVAKAGFQGRGAADANTLIAEYERATNGLDADKAFEALEGGRSFGKESDLVRYNNLMNGGGSTPQPQPSPSPSPAPSAPNTNQSNTAANTYAGSQQNVSQDNDVNINGDGNSVMQDNSVTHYGDSIRTFNYQSNNSGSGGANYDTPASMATLAGYYSPDDGAGETAKFLDKYIRMNNIAHRKTSGEHDAMTNKDYKSQTDAVQQFNPLAMQERIDRSPIINRSRSTVDFANLFGDVHSGQWATQWTPTTAPAKIESNVEDIADKYKDDLD
jgi:hypothetical protein